MSGVGWVEGEGPRFVAVVQGLGRAYVWDRLLSRIAGGYLGSLDEALNEARLMNEVDPNG